MNKIWISIVLIISLMGCSSALDGSGVELRSEEAAAELLFNYGIGQPWVSGNPPSLSASDSIYSQYYSIYEGSATKKHIEAPKKHVIKDETPTTVYFGYQMQAVPYFEYQNYVVYLGGNSLWIQGSTSWTQYARVPQGSILSLLASSPTGGDGYLYEIYPDGKLSKNSFYVYPGNSQISFYADSIGQHVMLFVIGSQVSNAIVVDVTNYYPLYHQPIPTYLPTQILHPAPKPYPTTGDPYYWDYYPTYRDYHHDDDVRHHLDNKSPERY
ncbi:MAG: hypothetical protein MUO26_00830 [Methanotrichaceae archaeon]|nr:hypothetical protein [Methanotrichaceae archaeon]